MIINKSLREKVAINKSLEDAEHRKSLKKSYKREKKVKAELVVNLKPMGYKLIHTNGYVYQFKYGKWDIDFVDQRSGFCATIRLHTKSEEELIILRDKWTYNDKIRCKIEGAFKEKDFICPPDWFELHRNVTKHIGNVRDK